MNWRLLTVFIVTRVLFNSIYRMIYPFLAVFARALGVDLNTLALILTACSVVGAVSPLIAIFADARGRRAGMLMGSAFFAGSLITVTIYPTIWGLALAICISALGKFVFDPAMQAFLGDTVPLSQRGRVIAFTELSWSLAFIAGVPFWGWLIARSDWLMPFRFAALLGALVFMLLWRLLPHTNGAVLTGLRDGLRHVFTSVPALAGLSIGLWISAANEMVNLVFGVWLEDTLGLQLAALSAAATVIGLSELSGEGLVALLTDRLGIKRAISLGILANMLAAVLLLQIGQSTAGALLGLFLFYLSFEFTLVSLIPMMIEILPQARATLLALEVSGIALGRALGAFLAAWAYGYGFIFSVAGAVLLNGFASLALRPLRQGMSSSR